MELSEYKAPKPPERPKIEYLEIKELILNEVYYCRLTGNKVMIVDKEIRSVLNRECITGIYYNNKNGYTVVDIIDYMLHE